jgi:hypothetical protein
MTSGPIVIVGAGGFGREVLDVIEAINAAGGSLEFRGFIDDGPVDESCWRRRDARCSVPAMSCGRWTCLFVVAIGSGPPANRWSTACGRD